MSEKLYFDDLQVGDEWTSPRRTVTETDIVNFACLTGDFDPLHTDHEFASQTPFGKPIAHGLLGLSYLAGLSTNAPAVMTEAFVAIREWKFVRPIFIGDTIHALTKVEELHERNKRRGTVIWRRYLMNQNDEAVQEGILETVVSRKRN